MCVCIGSVVCMYECIYVCSFVPVEGEMFGEIKDQSSLLNTRRAVLSLDQLKLVCQFPIF